MLNVERVILDDSGDLSSYTFGFDEVSVGDGKRLADMLKWNAECDFGHHRGSGAAKFTHSEIENVRNRSRCFVSDKPTNPAQARQGYDTHGNRRIAA